MGGTAYLIYGDIEAELLQPRPIKQNFFDKLLTRQRYKKPKQFSLGDVVITELTVRELEPLKNDFSDFLKLKMPNPWEATKTIYEYLDVGVMDIYLRGEKQGGSSEKWYIQIGFSGCAGMDEVSANVACHWADIWYRTCQQEIKGEYLEPLGFHPEELTQKLEAKSTFIPLLEGGYAAYFREPQEFCLSDQKELSHFEIDVAATEELHDGGLQLINELEHHYKTLLTDGKCRCQLCMPSFNEFL